MADGEVAELQRKIERKLARAGVLANLLGALDLFFFTALLLPANLESVSRGELALVNGLVFVPYMIVTLTIGERWARRLGEPVRAWLGKRDPTPAERDYALRLPLFGAR